MILRCKFTKIGDISYISHLDLLKIFIRALRRSQIEVNYSEGFHPHPKISFSSALSLGIQSYAEFIDIDIKDPKDENDFINRINDSLPEGIDITEYKIVEKPEALTKMMSHSLYEFYFDQDLGDLENIVSKIMEGDTLIIQKKNKKKQLKEVNVREKIYDLEIKSEKNMINAILLNSTEGALKPSELIKAINENYNIEIKPYLVIKRASMFLQENGSFKVV